MKRHAAVPRHRRSTGRCTYCGHYGLLFYGYLCFACTGSAGKRNGKD